MYLFCIGDNFLAFDRAIRLVRLLTIGEVGLVVRVHVLHSPIGVLFPNASLESRGSDCGENEHAREIVTIVLQNEAAGEISPRK